MKIAELSVNRPISTIVAVVLVALFGVIALFTLPIQMKPTVDKPIIRINTVYPGAAPSEVEQQVTDVFEEKVNAIQGLEKLSSTSSDSSSSIELEFSWGEDKDARFLDVIEKVNQIENLPEEAEKPIVAAVSSVDEERIMWIMITSDTLSVEEMTHFAKEEIKDAFAKVKGVGDVIVFGGRERQINILLDPKAMIAKNITVTDIRRAILSENLNVRGGYIDEGKMRYNVRTLGQFKNLNEIENLSLRKTPEGVIYLRDVAQVEDTYEPLSSTVRGPGMRRQIVVGISRKIGANVVETTEHVRNMIARLNDRFKEMIYHDRVVSLKIIKAYDESEYIWESMNFVSQNLLFGALLAAFVLIFFLKSIRAVFVVSITIPVCFITNFIFLHFLGRTINIISLAGIAFAVGMTVDNAIVVIENIYRHLELGKKLREAAILGIQEVWGAILASTLTTIAVFIPILYISGEAGELFRDIAISISCSVAISLVLSFTLVVMMSSRILKHEKKESRFVKITFLATDYLGKAVGIVLLFITKFVTGKYIPKKMYFQIPFKLVIALLIIIPTIFVSWYLFPSLEYLPTGNRNMILVIYKVPPGTNIDKLSNISASMEQKLDHLLFDPQKGYSEDNKILERMVAITSSQFNIIINVFKDKYARMPVEKLPMQINPMTGKPFAAAMDYLSFLITMATYGTPGTDYAFAIRPGLFGRFRSKGFDIEVRGTHIEKIDEIANKIKASIEGIAREQGLGQVTKDFEVGLPEIRLELDRERISELGLKVTDVAEVVETFVAGKKTGKYRDGSDEVDIIVRVPEHIIDDIEQLKMTPLFIPNVGSTNMMTVAHVYTGVGPTKILHKERNRAITLSVNLDEKTSLQNSISYIRENIIEPIKKEIPADYNIEISGSASDLEKTLAAFFLVFPLSVIVIYLLLCSLFESFFYPLIIMISVPLAVSGGILAVYFNDVPCDVLTMLGFLILGGIVVNNAILVVHQTLNFTQEGMNGQDAIYESVRTRLRPAFMSTITTVFGLIPMCIKGSPGSELYSGLATAITGGLVFSTFLIFIVVPLILSILNDIKAVVSRIEKKAWLNLLKVIFGWLY